MTPSAASPGTTRSARAEVLRGIGVSPGVAIGRALLLQHEEIAIFRIPIGQGEVKAECSRFQAALRLSRRQLREIKARMMAALGREHGYIFDAQLLMLDDSLLRDGILNAIRHDRVNAEWAVKRTLDELVAIFDQLRDDYLRERKGDIFDVAGRLLRNLAGGRQPSPGRLERDYILVSDNLQASDTGQLDWDYITGLGMEAGSRTYHTAIIARSLEIPCVVGVHDLARRVGSGATLILDGNEGLAIVNPDRQLLRDYRAKRKKQSALGQKLLRLRDLPALTVDGRRILLQANIEFPEEGASALRHGAEGIGLFRSEWFFARASGGIPDEEEQYRVYRKLAEEMSPHSVVVRTFDVGPAQLPDSDGAPEPNPALGLRAIRLLLDRKDLFRTQLRALLRARRHGKLKVMFPMISGVEEFRQARGLLEEVREELAVSGQEFDPDLPCGVTIEVPSAAATADLLAREADFLSIGSNDLIQYYLAVDRGNERVSHLYNPLHPAILRAIRFVIDSAHAAGIKVGMCGEMAADPLLVVILVGMGLDELSMNTGSILPVKSIIRRLSAAEAREIAGRALELATPGELSRFVAARLAERMPEGLHGRP